MIGHNSAIFISVDGAKYVVLSVYTLINLTKRGFISAKSLPSKDRLYSKEELDEFVDDLPYALALEKSKT